MRAMILAAGRGERLRPLTDHCPKPLIRIGNETLIERHIRRLCEAGFVDIVINLWHLGDMIKNYLGNGDRWQARLHYSPEPQLLGTVGGIAHAVHNGLLTEPFALVNGDVWSDYPFAELHNKTQHPAHLILTPNPSFHPKGDFSMSEDGQLRRPDSQQTYTYAGIGVYHPNRFLSYPAATPADFLPFIHTAIDERAAHASLYHGTHQDSGTPPRLVNILHQQN